jgi:hypothetical protein
MKNVKILFLLLYTTSIVGMERVTLPNSWLPGPDTDADQIFHYARHGNVFLIRYFAQDYDNANITDSKAYSPLHYACFSGSTETVQELVNCCFADVNVENSYGEPEFKQKLRLWKGKIATPLHCSVRAGNIEIVTFLLDMGAKIDSDYQKDGSTPLHLAAWFNFPKIAQLLIDRGADINTLNICGSSPVHSAAWRNSAESLAVLLNHNAQFTVRNFTGNGNTPLYLAAKAGSVECLRLLLAKDPNKKETVNLVCSGIGDDATPLEVAVARDHYQCCWDLISAGARLNCLRTSRSADILSNRPMLKKFLKNIEYLYYPEVYSGLVTLLLDGKYILCDICSKKYQSNDVVLCFPFHDGQDSHTFHDACLWKACWDKYYAKNKEHDFFKSMSKKEAEFEIRREVFEDEFLQPLQICPRQGCNRYLSFSEKKNRIMKVYNPTLEG